MTDRPDVTLQQLRSFCVVARLGSYAAAARELQLTSPAIWEQIHTLEGHYKQRLLVRRGNGVALTNNGEQLLTHLQPILAGLDSTQAALEEHAGQSPRILTVATNLRVLVEEIAVALGRFQNRRPDIRLQLIFTSNDVDARIAEGSADVGFTLEPGPDEAPLLSVAYEPAGEVDYLLVMPQGHPLASRRTLRLAHIVEERLVLAYKTAYSRRRVEEVFHRHDLTDRLRVAAETSSDEYTLPCVRAGLGVGITVGKGRGPLYQGLAVRSLRRWFGTARLGFLWKRGAHILTPQRELALDIESVVAGRT
jgi:DNA-binding transcriptional LysR family regulator